MSGRDLSFFDRSKLNREPTVLQKAMREYSDRFGAEAIGRCSTWDLDMTDEELADTFRECVKAGMELDDYLGLGGDFGNDDL